MEKVAIYGKGGIGKSVIATNLSAHFALQEQRVLHIGCDPKHDSSMRLIDSHRINTVLDLIGKDPDNLTISTVINRGRLNIDCIEAGGPEPGVGCGGRGVARMIEFIDEMEVFESGEYQTVIFDVLGDVVCGGFAAPLRLGFAEKVIIVLSEEPMALFAANNITKAIHNYSANGVVLAGLVANLRDVNTDRDRLHSFAKLLNSRILHFIERDPLITESERRRKTVMEYAPQSETADIFRAIANEIVNLDPSTVPLPTTLSEEQFFEFVQA